METTAEVPSGRRVAWRVSDRKHMAVGIDSASLVVSKSFDRKRQAVGFLDEFLAGHSEPASSIRLDEVVSVVADRPSGRLVVETQDSAVVISGWRDRWPTAGEALALLRKGLSDDTPRPNSDLEAAAYTLGVRAGLVLVSKSFESRLRLVCPGHVLPMVPAGMGEADWSSIGRDATFVTPRPHGRSFLLDGILLGLWWVTTIPGFVRPGLGQVTAFACVLALVLLNLPGFTRLDEDGVLNWRLYRWKRLRWEELDFITTDLVAVDQLSRRLRVVWFQAAERSYRAKLGRRWAAVRVAAAVNQIATARGVDSAVYAVDLDGFLSLGGKRVVRWPEPWPWDAL